MQQTETIESAWIRQQLETYDRHTIREAIEEQLTDQRCRHALAIRADRVDMATAAEVEIAALLDMMDKLKQLAA